jgi:3'-phosphoadenosine 5'-phosphosulfate sulfotransferase (PAPS reductase)/FAD synthetase
MQFCTSILKIGPAEAFLAEVDPNKETTCIVGVRRSESPNRRTFEEFLKESPAHGGRPRWAPLVDHTDEMRDELLAQAGFVPLSHRSMECYPCINANRKDFLVLAKDPERIGEIADIEDKMGHTKAGKPRTMFRPYHFRGATGIKQVIQWAEAGHGKFNIDDGTGSGCDSGYCGT